MNPLTVEAFPKEQGKGEAFKSILEEHRIPTVCRELGEISQQPAGSFGKIPLGMMGWWMNLGTPHQ